jgi:hypothetical protein
MFRTSGADLEADAGIVSGTNGHESLRVASEAFGASVLGLADQVKITLARSALDRLTVNVPDGIEIVIGGLGQDDPDDGPGDNHLIQR